MKGATKDEEKNYSWKYPSYSTLTIVHQRPFVALLLYEVCSVYLVHDAMNQARASVSNHGDCYCDVIGRQAGSRRAAWFTMRGDKLLRWFKMHKEMQVLGSGKEGGGRSRVLGCKICGVSWCKAPAASVRSPARLL